MTSERTVLLVVVSLVVISALGLITGAVLLYAGKPGGELLAIAAGALGGITGLLAKTDSGHHSATVETTVSTSGPDGDANA